MHNRVVNLPQFSQITRRDRHNPSGGQTRSRQDNRFSSSGHFSRQIAQEDEAAQHLPEDTAVSEKHIPLPGFSLASIRILPDSSQLRSHANPGCLPRNRTPTIRPVQAKLVINQPGDRYEKEADNVAEQVMRMPEPRIGNRSEMAQPPLMRRSCPKCRKNASEREDDEERLQMKPASRATPESSAAQSLPSSVPPIVHEVLRSPGHPLDPATRAFMEPRFGHDFSRVRVHADARAAESARSVNALAYTVGRDLVFASNLYAPQTDGRRLLAHELVHVVQQQENNYPKSVRVQRACGSAAIDEPTGCTTTDRGIHGLRYLFKVNCDDFAPGNEEDLKMGAGLIESGEIVEIHGLASIEGDPVYNLHLSCARALRAKSVIEAVLAQRGVSATILVFNHGATRGDATQQRSVIVSRSSPEPPRSRVCGPDATDWLIRQINAAKTDATILALQARLAGAESLARRYGFSAEAIAEGAVARRVLAEEARVGSPTRTAEASSQLAASASGQRAFGRALLAASVPLVGAPEALVLAAIRGAALTWKGLVQTGGKYDFKNDSMTMRSPTSENCPADCANTITLCPSTASDCFLTDVPGNLFYAHIGRFVGWTELSLQLGSQFAQLDSSAAWDPPEDTRIISLGFALPDPLSRSDLCSAINANRSIFMLRNCSNCDEETSASVV